MKPVTFAFVLTICSAPFLSPPAHGTELTIGFSDLKTLVEARNERILSSHRQVAASRTREGLLRRSFLPSLEVYGAQEIFKTGTQPQKEQPVYGIETRLNLYNGGRDKLRGDAQKLATLRREAETRATIAETLGEARELYWRLLYLRDAAALLRDATAVNTDNLRAANRRIGGGVGTISDRLEFEMNSIELNRAVAQNEVEQKSAQRDLLVLLGHEPELNVTIIGTLDHSDDWEAELKHSHEDHEFLVLPSKLLTEESRRRAQVAGRSWLPRVDAYAAWNQYNQREEDPVQARERQEGVLGIRMSVSLFDSLSSRNEAAAQREEAVSTELMSAHLEKQIEAHVAREFADLKFLHGQVHEADTNIQRAQTYYRLTQSEYFRGVKNSPDVLGASQKLLDMKRRRLELIRDFQISRGHLLSKIGR